MIYLKIPTHMDRERYPEGPDISKDYGGPIVYSYGIWQTKGKHIGEKISCGFAL